MAFLEDQKKEEITLSEIFAKIGLDKQNWDFRQTVEYLEFTHSGGVEMDFHFAIDVVTDLAAILLECSVSGSVNLQDLDEYNTPVRRIRITATPEEHDAMNKALADFAQNPLSYDLHEMMDDEEIREMARDIEALRKELYEAAGRNRDYYVKAEDMQNLLPDGGEANGCIATSRITVEGCKVGYCYREEPDGDWDSGWRFTAGDESDEYMDDPNNAGLYNLNSICNDDPDIIPLLRTPAPCAFERDENGVFQQIKDWKTDEDEEDPDMDILRQCQKWNEKSEYQKIIDALETIPAQERTPEMDSELARAYNNQAAPGDRELFRSQLAQLGMGLEERMRQPVGLLSGGQRQALTLLMATMVPPKLLLLDEHTAALDPATADKVLELTRRIVAEHRITCLMVTHNMAQALSLGSRTLMMAEGSIVLDVSGTEREGLTVNDLLERFRSGAGHALDNDRILLA